MKNICKNPIAFLVLAAMFLSVSLFPMAAFAEEGVTTAPEGAANTSSTTPEGGSNTSSTPPASTSPTASPSPTPAPPQAPNQAPTQEPTQRPTQEPTPEPPVLPVTLSIDNLNRYAGMDRPYQSGYVPMVQNGSAIIVLPLTASGSLRGNALTVTPQLGDPASSPFVFRNYQTTVWLQRNPVNDSALTVPSYLITLQLPLKADRVNGVYAVAIDVKGQNAADGSEVAQSYTTYVTITDGKNPTAGQGAGGIEKPTSQPKVIIENYTVSPTPILAGQSFTATITLKNTNEKKAVQNMTVNVSCDSTHLTLQNESSTIFVGGMAKGATTELELTYNTSLETPAQKYTILLSISYDDADAMQIASSGVVEVAVQQAMSVKMETQPIAQSVNAGDTMPLSIQVMNLGRSKVYNARVELAAPGLLPSGSAFIGNLEAGTAMQGKMDVFVGTKDMSEGYEGSDKYGYTSGTLTLIYEDANGQAFTESLDVFTTINEPIINTMQTTAEEKPKTAGQWWISIAIGAIVLNILGAVWFVRKHKGN